MSRTLICPHQRVACTGSTSMTMAASAALIAASRMSARTPARRRMRHAITANAQMDNASSSHFATSNEAQASGARTSVAKGG